MYFTRCIIKSDQNWIELIIKAANTYGSFGEYWTYASWVNHINKDDLNYYPYEKYGLTTERFYDDGNGLFSRKYKKFSNLIKDIIVFVLFGRK